ncbi:hypothetical protein HVPorG_04755 (plasmid) [Roseomonas mucosa]|nr:hypothetical protein HVPorG_04755 [Roseomonas mucosa]
MGFRSIGCFSSRIALVDIGQIDALARRGLHCLSETPHLSAIVSAGGRDMERQQMPQRVDRQVQLGTLLPLGTVCPSSEHSAQLAA